MREKKNYETASLEIPLLCEIAGDSAHLIPARYIAGILILSATAFCSHILDLPLAEGPLYFTGISLLLYNSVLAWHSRKFDCPDPALRLKHIRRNVLSQVILDWIALAAFLHLTGGICSPAIPMILLHIVIVAILMSRAATLLFVILDLGTLTLITVLEGLRVIPHYNLIDVLPLTLHTNLIFIVSQLGFVAIVIFAIGYLVTNIMGNQRKRDHRIAHLLDTMREISSTLKMSELLADLTRCSVGALSASGASIRLVDESSGRLTLSAAYGLSEAYIENGRLELSIDTLENELLVNPPIVVNSVADDPRVQTSDQLIKEGIHSMVTAPMIIRGKPFGILNVYSSRKNYFGPANADLVAKLAHLGTIALENAISYKRLQDAGQERSMFVRMVTHELRSPISGAQSLVKSMLSGLVGSLEKEQRELLERVESRLEQLMTLVNDLLALAAGRMIDSKKPLEQVSLQPILRYVINQWNPQAESKNIDLSVVSPEQPIVVRATQDGLAQVFSNLIDNAIKYTPEGGQIRIEMVESQGMVNVHVSDTGIGIPSDDLPHIWDEFYRAKNTRTSEILGTGLGLSIVRTLMDHFGGLIRVQSEETIGSTFTLTLQVEPSDGSSAATGADQSDVMKAEGDD